VIVTLNTDDSPMFGATLTGEYLTVAETLRLTPAEIGARARDAVDMSFPPAAAKTAMIAEINAVERLLHNQCDARPRRVGRWATRRPSVTHRAPATDDRRSPRSARPRPPDG
jgi:adenosine deaminase